MRRRKLYDIDTKKTYDVSQVIGESSVITDFQLV
jgi:hypothetical protein